VIVLDTHAWLWWAPLGAASLHIVEEFVLPGGFPDWDRRYRPAIRKSITPRLHIIVNGLLLILAYDVYALRSSPYGASLWLTVMALLASNAIWHLVGAFKTRSYSPGMITGSLLYLPLTLYGYAIFLRTGQASVPTALAAAFLGSSYHVWIAPALHRRRARASAPPMQD
jgi:Protein of unknown function with HXXEE motif